MSLVIKLARAGKKNEIKFRIIVKEKRSRRNGAATDNLGFIENKNGEIIKKIDQKKLQTWLNKGAVLSDSLKKLYERTN